RPERGGRCSSSLGFRDRVLLDGSSSGGWRGSAHGRDQERCGDVGARQGHPCDAERCSPGYAFRYADSCDEFLQQRSVQPMCVVWALLLAHGCWTRIPFLSLDDLYLDRTSTLVVVSKSYKRALLKIHPDKQDPQDTDGTFRCEHRPQLL